MDLPFIIEAHEIDNTILSVPALDRKWLNSFFHLRDVEFPPKAGPIDLILGVQYSHLHAEEEVRQGLPFQPVGKGTRLGWHVIGADNTKGPPQMCSISFVQKINMEQSYETPYCSCPKVTMSKEDRIAMKLFEASCTKEENRYVIALGEYLANGWARPLTEEELKRDIKPVYYLPHHGVYRPDKPRTPLRVVFDPACKYQGVSLNSFLCKEPCLIGNLLGVLLRFRADPVAFTGDISKMFLQILLPEKDTHVHRFLWRNLQTQEQPATYVLSRVTFGDKPSPDIASFVMLRMAKENETEYQDASEILCRDRYMDDLIHSCSTPKGSS